MFSPVSWERYLRFTKTNLESTKNRTANAIKPLSKLANERFRLYLGNGIFDRHKITSNMQKMEQLMPLNWFQKRRMNVFGRI